MEEVGTWFDSGSRYQIRGTLGTGAYGVVYRVLDERWGQELALKTIQQPSPEVRQWLKAEYRVLRDIVHPNLVRLHDLHVDGERCFFTMDIVADGVPFTQRFDFDRAGPRIEQEVAIRRICRAGRKLAEALAAVHALGKCHRDIKPSNVLVTPSDHVVLLDFGLASPVERQRSLDTARGAILGTLPYLAPEQYVTPGPSPASDWYSAGLVLYEAVVGRLPFGADPMEEVRAKRRPTAPPSQVVGAVPAALDALIVQLLDPDPAHRPPANEVITALEVAGDERDERDGLAARAGTFELDADFIAREDELDTLARAMSAAAGGRLVTVEVVAPSGMGKTALVRHFLRRVPAATLVLEARCHPQESIPYKAFDAIVDDLARYWLGLDDAEARLLRPPEGAEALTLLFPELRRVAHLDPEVATPRGDPRALRQAGFDALQSVLTRIGRQRPLVLWVDDVQWADADSVALIERVFGTEPAPPVLLVLSRRPDAETQEPALLGAIVQVRARGVADRIDLSPLGEQAARVLAGAITARGGMDEPRVDAIVEAAAGVPYLIAELAHFDNRRGGRGETSIPTTAGSLMRERLAALSAADRAIVELAALSGASLPTSVLLDAAAGADRRRLRDLCILRLLRWTGTGGESVQIYHDRLREFVVDALAADITSARHLSLVTAMERVADSDAERMMAHALAAHDRPRTQRHALTAARRAETALAFDQAARLYEVALGATGDDAPRAELHELAAEALANAGRSQRAAPEFERAMTALERERPGARERRAFLRRRAGEQYLKAGHYDDGVRLMEVFLAEADVKLPRSGTGALAVSAVRRTRLYVRGFDFDPVAADAIDPRTRSRLDDLWAATTALSMMDPVRSDGVGLLHFHESLRAGATAHVARSLGYEAAFAALIGGRFLRRKAAELLRRNREALDRGAGPYERAFYQLGAGTSAFFHSAWDETVRSCDAATAGFRRDCRGAEYEAAVALVWSLSALGQAGRVAELCTRIPAVIREADSRGDLFAANNYRTGFHALARIAAGLIDDVQSDLRKVVETWKPGFYQMHAYHRVFAGVAADLSLGKPRDAIAWIENDWPALKAGLYLRMELPAMELRWTRARAALALAFEERGRSRRRRLARVKALIRAIRSASCPAAGPHAALLRAGLAVAEDRIDDAIPPLRLAVDGYSAAAMRMHAEVTRWALGSLVGGAEGSALVTAAEDWMKTEHVPAMRPLVRALAPGLDRVVRDG
jgi:hypothetical protein